LTGDGDHAVTDDDPVDDRPIGIFECQHRMEDLKIRRVIMAISAAPSYIEIICKRCHAFWPYKLDRDHFGRWGYKK